MIRPRKNSAASGIRTRDLPLSRLTLTARPTRRCNRVQMICNTSSACHEQHGVCRVVRRDSSAVDSFLTITGKFSAMAGTFLYVSGTCLRHSKPTIEDTHSCPRTIPDWNDSLPKAVAEATSLDVFTSGVRKLHLLAMVLGFCCCCCCCCCFLLVFVFLRYPPLSVSE